MRLEQLSAWLFEEALPIWAAHGLDPAGGFHDQLDDGLQPVPAPRRMRVQGRQIYTFARAGAAGWDGPWRQAMRHGLEFVCGPMRGEDGLFRSTYEDGLASGVCLYDNAFGLIALAHGFRATGDARLHDLALETWAALARWRRLPGGGFAEDGQLAATPHLHLYEAAITWRASTDAVVWREAATQIGDLAERVFLDVPRGRVQPLANADKVACTYEPGQAFEWSWLLMAERRTEVGRRLAEAAFRSGVSRPRNLALNLQDEAGAWADEGARLWPQTERLHAAVSYGAATAELNAPGEAALAQAAVEAFLAPAPRGLFRDAIDAAGALDRGPAKASSLYHLAGALLGDPT